MPSYPSVRRAKHLVLGLALSAALALGGISALVHGTASASFEKPVPVAGPYDPPCDYYGGPCPTPAPSPSPVPTPRPR